MQQFDTIWLNARLATLQSDGPGLSPIEPGAIASVGSRIAFVGRMGDLPTAWRADEQIDCEGRWITPGLIDCHTHLVHGGNRSREFELRLNGATYEEIAKAGGGILSTVNSTRASSEDELVASALIRLDHLVAEGVTTVEIKSGYGLELETERRMLRAARRLAAERGVGIRTTFLGAHALPPEAGGDKQSYISRVCREMIPAIAGEGLADAVDAFCEGIAFSPEEVAQVFAAAGAAGLPVKLHADQLSDLNGGGLAARYGALSADHLEYASEESIDAMRRSGTVAVLLPGAFYTLRETKVPPVAVMRRHGVPLAVGTDCNPGTSPLTSILTAMNMAATLFRLTPDECLAGVTREAARALGLLEVTGTLAVGKQCDLAIWNIEQPAELSYRIGFNPLHQRVWRSQCETR